MVVKNSTAFIVLTLSLIITACGGGGGDAAAVGGGTNSAEADTNTDTDTNTAVTGAISVSWDIPTTRVNGDLLPASEIAGYKIYLSTSNIIPSIPYATITNRALSEYTINNLESDTYTLYVTTYDTNGDESPYSDPISKTI